MHINLKYLTVETGCRPACASALQGRTVKASWSAHAAMFVFCLFAHQAGIFILKTSITHECHFLMTFCKLQNVTTLMFIYNLFLLCSH